MRSLFATLLLLHLSSQAFTQGVSLKSKPPLDTSVLGKWPELYGGALSADGRYLTYTLTEYIPAEKTTTIIQTPDAKWKRELPDVNGIQFTADSRSAVYLLHDTLRTIGIGHAQDNLITDVQSYRLVPYAKGEWLVYQLKGPEKQLIIQDVKTKKEKIFKSVDNYSFSKDGQTVVLQSKSEDGKENRLNWVDLLSGKISTIWAAAAMPSQILFNEAGTQVAFITLENDKRSVWHYRMGISKAELTISDADAGIDSGLVIGSLEKFSKDGGKVFLNLEKREQIEPAQLSAANVNVWRYNDIKLQPEQLSNIEGKKVLVKRYYYVLNINLRKLIQLQKEFENVIDKCEDNTLILHLDTDQDVGVGTGEGWNPALLNAQYFLVSNTDGSRKRLFLSSGNNYSIQFSPSGKYIIYADRRSRNYFCYEVKNGITRNTTADIKEDLTYNICYYNTPINSNGLIPAAGWLKDDSGILIYDRNDIWRVDPLGNKRPENVTNGYGKRNGLIFRLGSFGARAKDQIFEPGQKLIIIAFNKRTKENGHFTKVLGEMGDPQIINMQLLLCSVAPYSGENNGDIYPVMPFKSKNADAYLTTRQTVSDYPNYYYTKDLKHFQQITFLAPEKKFNWMTNELHTYVASDGDTLQSILYKPENFDSTKKYPVLFSIYRQFSDELNSYLEPKWMTERINIPWFVSHGYLVFTPDIHYRMPEPGLKESVVNCVLAAANKAAKFPFVDSNRMGIQGHSFGGVEMGYVITNTHCFAAGSSMAGSYDFISEAGTILPPPFANSRGDKFESEWIYGNMWQKKMDFIKNSALFDINNATTPLLLVAGEKDEVKPYDQSIEFFLGLRRLGKPVWMLTYPKEGHTLHESKNIKDYTIRITQFFDHFLMRKPAPKWMTQGIPMKLKGIETGYDIKDHQDY